MGQQEDPISQAEELIEEDRLNEAILLLERTIREEPERIHEAEDLLREIRRRRGSYNELFQQLIAHLLENPEDIETTLDIIDRMEALDTQPNERTRQQVAQARYIAQLAYDRARMERAMDRALVSLEQDRPLEAISIYLELREYQRRAFEERQYSEIFRNRVNQAVSAVYESTDQFLSTTDRVSERSTLLARALENPEDPSSPGPFPVESFLESLRSVGSLADRLLEASDTIRTQRQRVRLEFPEDPVDWYLIFQDQITRGRSEHRGEEGILPAIEAFLELQIEEPLRVANLQAETQRREAALEFDREEYATAGVLFPRMAPYYSVARRLVAASQGVYTEEVAPAVAEERFTPDALDEYLAATFRERSAAVSAELANRVENLEFETGDLPDDVALLEQLQEDARQGVSTLSELAVDWESSVATVVAQLEARELPPRSSAAVQEVLDRINSVYVQGAQQDVIRIAARIAEVTWEPLASLPREVNAELPEIARLVEASEEQIARIEEGEELEISRFPGQALQRYQALQARTSEAIDELRGLFDRFSEEPEYIQEAPLVREELTAAESLLSRTESVAETVAARVEEMEAQVAEAQELREQGDQLVAETRAALSALQVSTARNLWEQARDAYYESLSIQENVAFREEVDELVLSLGNEIQDAQNRLIVQQVRSLINEANTLYNEDEFGSARDALTQAEQLWSQVYVDPNPEVERLLSLVNAALSIEEGRELTATDPLFPVLGSYLNLAQQDYQEGRRLYTSGQQTQGERLLNRAIENLRNIRDVRPLNWNARILELRILQIIEEGNFPEVFAARYQDAVDRIGEGDLLSVYGELEALAEINPNYPGLQERIRELEIQLNLRQDPVDQARIAESNQLFAQAQRLAEAGSRDQAVVAVSLLEEAVDLNPNNQDAKFLMDSLRIRIGAQATVALNSADEQQYRLAETLFAQGQVARAFSIVERLLADPDNQGYPPLIELRRRIALRLGI